MTVERLFVQEKVKELDIKRFLKNELGKAGFSHADINRTPLGTRVVVHALRPGLVIGSSGENINRITAELKNRFKVENPHVEVRQVEVPELDAVLMAQRIGGLLEKGYYFKKVAHRVLEKVILAGARGVEIRISGKVPSERAKDWIFKSGYIRHCGEVVKETVEVGYYDAQLKSGTIGIMVRVMPPNVIFPDEILVGERVKQIRLTMAKAGVGEAGGEEPAG